MLTLKKILLPVDFSERGTGAARYAASLATHFQAELTLFHVNPFLVQALYAPREFSGPVDTGWITVLEAQRRRELDSYRTDEFKEIAVKKVVTSGDPATEIADFTHREHIDLIVMPTAGHGRFRRFLLGSVAAKVLHDVECPVWTGAHMNETGTQTWRSMDRLVCAIDGGPASEEVLRWTSHFAVEFGSAVTIVHAIPTLEAPDILIDPNWNAARIRTAQSVIDCLKRKAGVAAEVVVEEGEPSRVVADTVKRLDADLVVIGRTPAHSLLGRLRANAYAIISNSPCPVVSV
jgi:nucleotide-binding universal stress UspA family protein